MALNRVARELWTRFGGRSRVPESRIKRRGRGVLVLGYHGIREHQTQPDWLLVEQAAFEQQLRWLRAEFDIVAIDEAVVALRQGAVRGRLACVTFDDGYANNISLALPVLQRFRVPATIYLATSFIGSPDILWTVRLRGAIVRTRARTFSLDGESPHLRVVPRTVRGRNRLVAAMKLELAARPRAERMQLLARIEADLGRAAYTRDEFGFMGREDLAAGAASGLLTFGGHTVHHEILSLCSDGLVAGEVQDSIAAISRLGLPPSATFAYPNGEAADFDDRAQAAVQEGGCHAAVTTIPGFNRDASALFAMRRVLVPGHAGLTAFRLAAAGMMSP